MRQHIHLAAGLGRTKLELLDDGTVQMRQRVRTPHSGRGGRAIYHRALISPDDDKLALNDRGFPAELCDEEMYADTGVTLADVIEGYVEAHRTPERLARWEEVKRKVERDSASMSDDEEAKRGRKA